MAENMQGTQGTVVAGGNAGVLSPAGPSFSERLGNSTAYNMGCNMIGNVMNAFPTPRADLNTNTQMAATARGALSDAAIASGNPYAMAAGVVTKFMDKTGLFADSSEGLGKAEDIGNTIGSILLPGASLFMKETDKYKMSGDMLAMAGGYASAVKNAQTAEKNAGAKLLFGRQKAQNKINQAKMEDAMVSTVKQQTDQDYEAAASMTQSKAMAAQMALSGGYNQALARAGKFGMKFEKAKELVKKINTPKQIEEFKEGGTLEQDFIPTTEEQDLEFFNSLNFSNDIQEFEEGGKLNKKEKESNDVNETPNVIPEGSLHARLHHMEDGDKITKKGIPVVDNDGNQLAEIEVNEIVFNIAVTKKLEELRNKYKDENKDEYAIEAGKLIAQLIMENTEDRTGLIEQVQ